MEGGADGAPRHLQHPLHGEGDVPGRLAAGGVNEADGVAVEEEAGRDAGVAEEALEAGLGRGVPALERLGGRSRASHRGGKNVVQVGPGGVDLDEEELPLAVVVVEEGEVGAQEVAVLGEGDLEAFGEGRAPFRPGQDFVHGPLEEVAGEGGEIEDARGGLGVLIVGQMPQDLLLLCDALVGVGAGRLQGRRGDDEADRLEVAEPALVVAELVGRIRSGHRPRYPVTGQR